MKGGLFAALLCLGLTLAAAPNPEDVPAGASESEAVPEAEAVSGIEAAPEAEAVSEAQPEGEAPEEHTEE